MSRRVICRIIVSVLTSIAAVRLGVAQVCTRHTYLGNRPAEGNPGWHEEGQGFAHDQDFWYATQNPDHEPRLWRIHQKLAEIYRRRGDERRAKYHDARAVP